MKNLTIILFLMILTLQFISADVISPGQKNIPIDNIITNIADFKDYTFVRVCAFRAENQSIIEINSYEIIGTDGKIKSYYSKPCNENSVYAFKKVDLPLMPLTEEDLLSYINFGKGIKVIDGLKTIEYSTIADSRTFINREYNVSLNSLATNPSIIKTSRSYLIYLYYIIPLLALLIIAFILIKRYKNR